MVSKQQPSPRVPVFLGGHSMGGMVTILSGIRNPELWQVLQPLALIQPCDFHMCFVAVSCAQAQLALLVQQHNLRLVGPSARTHRPDPHRLCSSVCMLSKANVATQECMRSMSHAWMQMLPHWTAGSLSACSHAIVQGYLDLPACNLQGIVTTSPAVDVARDLALKVLQLLQPLLLRLCPTARLIPAIPVDFNTPDPEVVSSSA